MNTPPSVEQITRLKETLPGGQGAPAAEELLDMAQNRATMLALFSAIQTPGAP